MPCSSVTRHDGESVRRCVIRTSLARSLSTLLNSLDQIFELFRCRGCRRPVGGVATELGSGRGRPVATDCSGLPSNSVSDDTTHSSTRSDSSSTSTPSLRKISRCGLFLAAAQNRRRSCSRSRPALPSSGRHSRRARPSGRRSRAGSRRIAAAWRCASLLTAVFGRTFFEDPAELLPEGRDTCPAVVRARSSSSPSTRFDRGRPNGVDVARLLQDFSRDVQRQIARVDHAADKAQVGRHQLLGVVHDEDAPHIQLDPVAMIAVPQIVRRAPRNEQQLGVLVAALRPWHAHTPAAARCRGRRACRTRDTALR